MKKILLAMVMFLPLAIFAQEDAKKQMTKFEEFTSKTGVIVKFIDTEMPNLSLSQSYGASTGIRKLTTAIRIIKGDSDAYFYRLEKAASSSSLSQIAMIEYSDLVEINKALIKLASEVDNDVASNPDYLENKFKTVDGFEVGYYVSNGKAHWFLKLERYSRNTVFVKNQEDLIEAFKNAQSKIEAFKITN